MIIALVSHHTPNYIEMANITVPIKAKYATLNNYRFYLKTDEFLNLPDRHPSFEKVFYLSNLMETHPEVDWFWYSGCDCLITNLTVKLETLIDNNYHFIVTKDDHGINGDVFFIRNSPEGREYMKHLEDLHWSMTEQGHMWDDEQNPKWSSITKYISQNYMNSYFHKYYPHKPLVDKLGGRLYWEQGDFVMQAITGRHDPHTPSTEIYQWKLNMLNEVVPLIIYQ